MKLAVLRETVPDERRVAATPTTVKKYHELGFEVLVEPGAGENARFSDANYEAEGAKLTERAAAIAEADIILSVRGPDEADASSIKKGAVIIALFDPYQQIERAEKLAATGARLVALEFIPRISRAQSMDVLSSQANLAGYKSVLDALEYFGRAMPMMMTAAGTIAPAKVMVMGAGVAGLQALATAKRLGAVVSATDVRAAAKEQVESLGGQFVMVEMEEAEEGETAGGYAREMSEDYKKKQAELIAKTIARQDIVITTALIPGRPAPRLVTREMIQSMQSGSVIVDLAAVQGGNVEGTVPGSVVEQDGVTIIGHTNVPSRLARDASALFAKNLLNYLSPFCSDETFALDDEDEIVAQSTIAEGGRITHAQLIGGNSKSGEK